MRQDRATTQNSVFALRHRVFLQEYLDYLKHYNFNHIGELYCPKRPDYYECSYGCNRWKSIHFEIRIELNKKTVRSYFFLILKQRKVVVESFKKIGAVL